MAVTVRECNVFVLGVVVGVGLVVGDMAFGRTLAWLF